MCLERSVDRDTRTTRVVPCRTDGNEGVFGHRGCVCCWAMDRLPRACAAMAPFRTRVGSIHPARSGSRSSFDRWTRPRTWWTASGSFNRSCLVCTRHGGKRVGSTSHNFASYASSSHSKTVVHGSEGTVSKNHSDRLSVLEGVDPTRVSSILQDHLQLYNSLGRTKEKFNPITPGRVTMYVCGVTVYDHAHVGHARAYVAFDVLYRVLRKAGYQVQYCRNVTDIDDKIIARAQERKESTEQLAETYYQSFRQDMERLHCLPPTMEPRATHHIKEAVDMIQRIVENGHGYQVPNSGDVYFAVGTLPAYGKKLAMREQEDNKAGAGQRARERAEMEMLQAEKEATVDSSVSAEMCAKIEREFKQSSEPSVNSMDHGGIGSGKRDASDFALWKSAKPGEPWWDSPWGRGRPGWHIECSSMVQSLLGQRIDIHGGGVDLMFPHHENEIAQCEASCGCKTDHNSFSNFWMHNGFVNVDSEKMSKSLGNFFTIKEVLRKYHSLALRWFLVGTHYRSAINYTQRALEEASERSFYLYQTMADVRRELLQDPVTGYSLTTTCEVERRAEEEASKEGIALVETVLHALADDLNTPLAIGAISQPLKILNDLLHTKKGRKAKDRFPRMRANLRALEASVDCLGMYMEDPDLVLSEMRALALERAGMDEEQLEQILEKRLEARRSKNFELSDCIRDELAAQGIMLMDGAQDGSRWKPAMRQLES